MRSCNVAYYKDLLTFTVVITTLLNRGKVSVNSDMNVIRKDVNNSQFTTN